MQYASERLALDASAMTTIRAEDVRIPRHAREAVARHEHVTVMNRERPAFVVVHPDDTTAGQPPTRRGRRLGEALGLLANAALPDPGFADDMEAVLGEVGRALRMIRGHAPRHDRLHRAGSEPSDACPPRAR